MARTKNPYCSCGNPRRGPGPNQRQCKQCRAASVKRWKENNVDRNEANKRRWFVRNFANYFDKHIWFKFHIRLADYERMLAQQNGVCKICLGPPIGKRFCIDHCHKTGKIRGLLCSNCNSAIGLLKDDPAVILRAVGYLKEHRSDG